MINKIKEFVNNLLGKEESVEEEPVKEESVEE